MRKVFLSVILTILPLLASAQVVEIDNGEIDGIWYILVKKLKEAKVTRNPTIDQYYGSYSGSIEIPISVTKDGIEYSVTSIDDAAFSNCSSLTSVTIPNSVTSIGGSALYGCSGLTSVTIPNSVTSIGSSAFSGCSGLTSVTIPNSVTSISSSAFYNTGWYNNQANGLLYLDKWLLGYKGYKPVGELSIAEGTKGITGFSYCSGLTSVTIPNSVTSIGSSAFENCSGLTSVTIPNSVTSIGSSAFSGCSGLTSVTIPNSVTSIGVLLSLVVSKRV